MPKVTGVPLLVGGFDPELFSRNRKCCWCGGRWRDHNEYSCGNAAGTKFYPMRVTEEERQFLNKIHYESRG